MYVKSHANKTEPNPLGLFVVHRKTKLPEKPSGNLDEASSALRFFETDKPF
jgi:hypothetical protein